MDDKAMKCIFVGYSAESKGYRLYHSQTKRILVSWDVVFVEDFVQPLLSCTRDSNVSSQDIYDTFLPLFSGGSMIVNSNEANVQPMGVSENVTDQPITDVDVHDVLDVLDEEKVENEQARDVTLYQTAVGCLIYVYNTRPDIQFAVSQGGSLPPDLHAFSDSDWAGCFDTQVSTSGFCFMLGSSCISWLSKKQPTVATSSYETEYRAVFTATIECVWLRRLMADLGVGQDTTNPIYTDSQSTLAVARNPIFHARTKHIEAKRHGAMWSRGHHFQVMAIDGKRVTQDSDVSTTFDQEVRVGSVAPRSQHIFEKRDSLEQMLKNKEFLHFIDKEETDMSKNKEDEREQSEEEEEEDEFSSSSDSAFDLPDADDDVQSQSTRGLNLEVVLNVDSDDMQEDMLELS
ncbi:hypothetical protein L7F22_055336 [Adiantum nelumboides]|nr:hypothetical protein [Adiantum nelumboides]